MVEQSNQESPMKRIYILLVLILSVCPLYAGGSYLDYTIIDEVNKTVSVKAKYNSDISENEHDIVIPETVEIGGEYYTVVEIPEEGFKDGWYHSVVIPNTVTSIGESAFYYSGVRSVTFGTGIQKIGRHPFQGCRQLKELIFLSEIPPYTSWYYLTEYVDHKIAIKTDKKFLMNYACCLSPNDDADFYSFSSDRPLSTYFDDNYEYLACDETKECIITKCLKLDTKLIDFVIPDTATLMFGLASDEYKIVGVGPSVFSTYASPDFKHNENVTGELTMGKNIRCIGYRAFAATDISQLNLNNDLKIIGFGAFQECNNLQKTSFSQNIRRIEAYAFSSTKLEEIILPRDLELIGAGAFSYIRTCVTINSEFNESLKYIEDCAFYHNTKLQSVILPDNLKEIGSEAFSGCTSLTSVKFGRNLEYIGPQAFNEAALERIEIPPHVKSIDNYAFLNCGLKEIIFEDGLYPVNLGKSAIDCDNIEYMYCGRNISMTPTSFKKLHTVDIGNLVTKIPDSFFKNSLRLTTVNFGSGLKEIGAEAFKYCSLADIILPSNIRKLGRECFSGNRLNSVTIGAGLSEIEDKAFEGNTNLSIINLTAPEPPKANVNVFTTYSARLNTDPRYSANYNNPNICWSLFKQDELIKADNVILDRDLVLCNSTNQIQLHASILPENVSLNTVLWESSDPNIAIVNTNGLVSIVDETLFDPVASGHSCKIRAYTLYSDGPVAECTFANNLLVSSILLNPDTIKGKDGDQIQIIATVLPDYAADKQLEWSSTDENVASVNEDGVVSLHAPGDAVITAFATDGSEVSAECCVSVADSAGAINLLADTPYKLSVDNGCIFIRGKFDHDIVEVFNIQGQLITSSTNKIIPINAKGIYLVKIGSYCAKITL